jgi:two-component system nitrate/nitrite response regulator NarP
MIRLLLADDHPFILDGVVALLRGTQFEVVARANDGAQVLTKVAEVRPDVVVLDVEMPEHDGLAVLRILRSKGDNRPVVLLTASLSDQRLHEALELGVNGIVLKNGAQMMLTRCLEEVSRGGRWIEGSLLQKALDLTLHGPAAPGPLKTLAPRERAIAELVAQGMRNRDIATKLGMSEGSVKVYLHRMYEKLGVGSRTELALLARDAH